ncbi:MAG: KpsF/GutQ family sugar-phosphate isomerase [Thermoguttaceae bacterium]|nr:KpsF/GutQ family sugar-phosphate isomerase [Thermoguttaceae bacterium]
MSQGRLNTNSFARNASLRIVRFPGEEEELLSVEDKESVLASGRAILQRESQAVQALSDRLGDDFCRAAGMILRCRGCVIVCGIGKAGHVGRKISATFASTGTPSWFLSPSEAIHGDLGCLRSEDVLLILSYSGETEEITRLLPCFRERNLVVIAITTRKESTLGQGSTVTIPLGTLAEADRFNLAPSTSSTAMLALGDAIALTVSATRGFRAEDFAKFHPGGSLGRRLAKVEDYMRPLRQCRISHDKKTIREIFVESHLPGRRPGAILLVDDNGRLSGIFTDSDLAKLFETGDCDVLDRIVCEVMTKSPKVVRYGAGMPQAIALMGEKKISELPVLDDNNVPVGMLDITDLVAFGLESGD